MQSVPINTKVVSSNPAQTRCTQYTIKWLSLSVTYDRPVLYSFEWNDLRWEVVVCFVDIGDIVHHHCLCFLFILYKSLNEKYYESGLVQHKYMAELNRVTGSSWLLDLHRQYIYKQTIKICTNFASTEKNYVWNEWQLWLTHTETCSCVDASVLHHKLKQSIRRYYTLLQCFDVPFHR
jgi:hypothetical protein